jgi:hypothetical protein
MNVDERIERAGELYKRAAFGGDTGGGLATAERELNAVEADLALARGRILHARFLDTRIGDPAELPLFERAVQLYQALGDVRGEAESLFWVGCFHQAATTPLLYLKRPATSPRSVPLTPSSARSRKPARRSSR